MYNTLQKVTQALESVQQMTPEQWAELDNDAWQLAQDVRDCCKAIADRIDVLEMMAPVPAMDEVSRQNLRKEIDQATFDAFYNT